MSSESILRPPLHQVRSAVAKPQKANQAERDDKVSKSPGCSDDAAVILDSIDPVQFKIPMGLVKNATKSVFQNRSSPPPPFRPGGRGSKQLVAIEYSKEKSSPMNEEQTWVFCSGKPPYYAKVISGPSEASENVMLQPLHQSPHDKCLLLPWDGHLWLAKREKLKVVKMKKEPGGFRVIDDPYLDRCASVLSKGGSFIYPQSIAAVHSSGKQDWDTISLESSEFDDASSVDSALFPLLADKSSAKKWGDCGDGIVSVAVRTTNERALSSDKGLCDVDESQGSQGSASHGVGLKTTASVTPSGPGETPTITTANHQNGQAFRVTPSVAFPLNDEIESPVTLTSTVTSAPHSSDSVQRPPDHLRMIIPTPRSTTPEPTYGHTNEPDQPRISAMVPDDGSTTPYLVASKPTRHAAAANQVSTKEPSPLTSKANGGNGSIAALGGPFGGHGSSPTPPRACYKKLAPSSTAHVAHTTAIVSQIRGLSSSVPRAPLRWNIHGTLRKSALSLLHDADSNSSSVHESIAMSTSSDEGYHAATTSAASASTSVSGPAHVSTALVTRRSNGNASLSLADRLGAYSRAAGSSDGSQTDGLSEGGFSPRVGDDGEEIRVNPSGKHSDTDTDFDDDGSASCGLTPRSSIESILPMLQLPSPLSCSSVKRVSVSAALEHTPVPTPTHVAVGEAGHEEAATEANTDTSMCLVDDRALEHNLQVATTIESKSLPQEPRAETPVAGPQSPAAADIDTRKGLSNASVERESCGGITVDSATSMFESNADLDAVSFAAIPTNGLHVARSADSYGYHDSHEFYEPDVVDPSILPVRDNVAILVPLGGSISTSVVNGVAPAVEPNTSAAASSEMLRGSISVPVVSSSIGADVLLAVGPNPSTSIPTAPPSPIVNVSLAILPTTCTRAALTPLSVPPVSCAPAPVPAPAPPAATVPASDDLMIIEPAPLPSDCEENRGADVQTENVADSVLVDMDDVTHCDAVSLETCNDKMEKTHCCDPAVEETHSANVEETHCDVVIEETHCDVVIEETHGDSAIGVTDSEWTIPAESEVSKFQESDQDGAQDGDGDGDEGGRDAMMSDATLSPTAPVVVTRINATAGARTVGEGPGPMPYSTITSAEESSDLLYADIRYVMLPMEDYLAQDKRPMELTTAAAAARATSSSSSSSAAPAAAAAAVVGDSSTVTVPGDDERVQTSPLSSVAASSSASSSSAVSSKKKKKKRKKRKKRAAAQEISPPEVKRARTDSSNASSSSLNGTSRSATVPDRPPPPGRRPHQQQGGQSTPPSSLSVCASHDQMLERQRQLISYTTVESPCPQPRPRSQSDGGNRPVRNARATSTSFAQRNAFLGAWPTRHQSAATGTWSLK